MSTAEQRLVDSIAWRETYIERLEARNAKLLDALETAQKTLNDLSDFYVGHPDHNIAFAADVTLTRHKVSDVLARATLAQTPETGG